MAHEEYEPTEFEGRYLQALDACLSRGTRSRAASAERIGVDAHEFGLETLVLARIHDSAVAELTARDGRAPGTPVAARADEFFAAALRPLEPARSALAECARLEALLDDEVARCGAAEDRATSHRGEIERLNNQAERFTRERRGFLRRLLKSQDDERKRISRDLHDALGQTLAGAHIALAKLAHDAAESSKDLRENVAFTRRLVQRSMKTVHRFARELHPAELEDLGLPAAVKSLANGMFGTGGTRVNVDVDVEGNFSELDSVQRTALYRVVQEALTNVRRHARADNVSVSLQRLPHAVRLEVTDDGRSFDAARLQKRRKAQGLGLRCMRERTELLDGAFTLEAAPGAGTTIRAEIPLPEGDSA